MKNLIRKIRSRLTGKPFFNIDIEHPIKEAFISGGIQYYMFEDIFNAPFNRAFEAQTFYNELQMRVDKEYLQDHVMGMKEILGNKNGINVGNIAILTQQLAERMDFIVDADLLYKLASVMYFDDNESPFKYDFGYGVKKMARWKKDRDIEDFFLNTPIKDFIPFSDILEKDLSAYLRVTEAIKTQHEKNLSSMLSKGKKTVAL